MPTRHATRGMLVAIAYLATGCAPRYMLTERVPPTGLTWSWHALCPTAETLKANPLMGEDLQNALDEWQVEGWSVGVEDAPGCVPVHLVEAGEDWPLPGAVGVAEFGYDGQPTSLWFDLEFWLTCPMARWALLLHEVGHAVGHWEHRDGGLMSSTTTCNPGWVAVDGESREYATLRRAGEL